MKIFCLDVCHTDIRAHVFHQIQGLKGVGEAQMVLDKSIRGSESNVDGEVIDGAGQESVNLIIKELLRRKSG